MSLVLILLPPSEGKRRPTRGKVMDLGALSQPELTNARQQVLDGLRQLCNSDRATARRILGIPATMDGEIESNTHLLAAPSAAAATIYTGVLFAALALPALSGDELRRANKRIVIMSALFGVVRPADRIAAYRLSGGVSLPVLGGLGTFWRKELGSGVSGIAEDGLVVDLRSAPYRNMWRPSTGAQAKWVEVKIWQRSGSAQRIAVSHFNKTAKGSIAHQLATTAENITTPNRLVEFVGDHGWEGELSENRLDVYIP